MHEMSMCDCGREIHWPRNSRYGDRWRCHACGRNWTLAPEMTRRAKPGYLVPSRRPKPKPRVVVVQVATPPDVNPFIPQGSYLPPPPPMRQLPAPPRRGGLLAWLFGE